MKNNVFFLKRLNDHVQYLRRMKGRIDGKNNFEPTTCYQCALGQWLYGEGRQEASQLGETMEALFEQLLLPHEQFHLASEATLNYRLADDEVGMRRTMTDMYRLSNTLIDLLLKMDALKNTMTLPPTLSKQRQ